MRRGLTCNGLALLVACSGLLTVDDYNRLNNTLWQTCLDTSNPFIQARVCATVLPLRHYHGKLSHPVGGVPAYAKRGEDGQSPSRCCTRKSVKVR